jgi:DNA-binding PadR family transcriptional regulator
VTEAALQILLSLADGDQHGYAIMGEITARTGNRVRLYPGTLYANIRRLLDDGLIEELDPPAGEDERRRYYRLTRHGRAAARAELDRLETIVRTAPAALKGR